MVKKLSILAAAIALVCSAGTSHAQSPFGPLGSITDMGNGSIVVIDKQETGIPGFFHQRYVYAVSDCVTEVDFYGPAIDPTDPSLLRLENRFCMDDRDGEADNAS